MASTNFNDFTTPAVSAEWLNDTNRFIYLLAGDGVNAPLNDSDVKTNLGITADIAAAVTAAPGRLIGVQVFTANATYTPTAGTTSIIFEAQGAGGGGGGGAATGAGQMAVGGAGGSGGYVRHRMTSGFSGQPIVVGAAGAGGGAGLSGSAGGSTTLAGIGAGGGAGGSVGPASAAGSAASGAGGTASGGNILNIPGKASNLSIGLFSAGFTIGPPGPDSRFGNGGASAIATTSFQFGNHATGYGAGGGGSAAGASQGATTGGNGSPGILIIYEYS